MNSLTQSLGRYTRFVLFGKHALWVLAALCSLALVVVANINRGDATSRITLDGDGAKTPQKPEPAAMLRPRYQGLDSNNRPFNVTADRAIQRDANTVLLSRIDADMTMDEASWLALSAANGTYYMKEKLLDLKNGVQMFYEGGYEFRTPEALVAVDAGAAKGEKPVEGQGPLGTLKADRFTILNRGAILRFNGNVNVVLYL